MPASTITLRFESKDGQFRLQVEPDTHFTDLLSKVGSGFHILEMCRDHCIMLEHIQDVVP